MAKVHFFTFNMMQENTYIVYDETGEAVIIDAGCINANEQSRLSKWLEANKLRPVRYLCTHCHLDHVFGNAFIWERYQLKAEIHEGELPVLQRFELSAQRFGIFKYDVPPMDVLFLKENTEISFGNTTFKILYCPGHSPASVCFYSEKDNFLIGGDVLFEGSIGRTDLPGGNHRQLINSIETQLLPLPDNTVVYAGHGNPTTIGQERYSNPFLQK